MEMENNISLGKTIFNALSLRKKYIFSKYYTPLYKKDVKETQNKPIETTSNKNSKNSF